MRRHARDECPPRQELRIHTHWPAYMLLQPAAIAVDLLIFRLKLYVALLKGI
jgi:hypothetical protein